MIIVRRACFKMSLLIRINMAFSLVFVCAACIAGYARDAFPSARRCRRQIE
jgi:hypothetical protein